LSSVKKISIVGVGLIGGSLALALKRAHPRLKIIGYDYTSVLKQALKRGMIDEAATDPLSAVIQSECIIIATPISTTVDMIRRIGKFIPPGTLVSDVCSVKGPIMAVAKKFIPKEVLFIGGHPMTGSERSGLDSADALLFENAYYTLCPLKHLSKESRARKKRLRAFVDLLQDTGARVVYLDAGVHDRLVASVSHLPQLLAVALVNLVGRNKDPRALKLAAGGFRDLTRVASSPFGMWGEILEANKKEVSQAIGKLMGELVRYRKSIVEGKVDRLLTEFSNAKKRRDEIPKSMKGFHRPLADIFVALQDKPGQIKKISSLLYQHRINIKDMELLKVREGERGTFRLSFDTARISRQAISILRKAGYKSS
jgi:prephenate dehydrogenase